jgi:hypothetical protein
VKKKKDKDKEKRVGKARRKEEHEKRRKMLRQTGEEEEESSNEEDDEDDDDKEIHQYDWLDSMVEEGEQLEGSSLSMEGRMPKAHLLLHEPEDPNLEGAMVAGRGGEPLRP